MTSITEDLATLLAKIRRPCDFVVSGTTALAMPSLVVEGLGQVALPLLPLQAEQLTALAERAHFGRGTATLVDTNVRRTWQLGPDKVRIEGTRWDRMLAGIVERVATGLGVADPVKAQFYKMLVYQPGDFFVGHRDTEKVPGMFATLVLRLPSASTGGELVVRHKDRMFRSDLKADDPSDIAYAAFFADCLHEVLPVTAGYRLNLVYNLVRSKRAAPIDAPDFDDEIAGLAGLLREWATAVPSAERPEKLVYPLDHAYSAAEIGFATLKGADSGAASVLAAAANGANCDLCLAQLMIHESGWAEAEVGYRGRGRSAQPEFSVGEVTDRYAILSAWRSQDGSPIGFDQLPIDESRELSPPDVFADVAPDEEAFSEATGNEGASFERSYRRAALVVWPKHRCLAILNQAGLKVALPYLGDLVGRWKNAANEIRESLAEKIRQLSSHMLATWQPSFWPDNGSGNPSEAHTLLTLLARFGEGAPIERFFATVLTGAQFRPQDVPVIVAALKHLDADRAAALIEAGVAAPLPEGFSCWSTLLAAAAGPHPGVAGALAKVLLREMPGDPGRPARLDRWGRPRIAAPSFADDLLIGLLRLDSAMATAAVKTMLASPQIYGMDDILLPAALRLAAIPDVGRLPAALELRDVCLAYLLAKTAERPEPPADAARAATLHCTCPQCRDLSLFLADRVRKNWLLKAAEAQREHVKDTIRRASADLSCTLDQRGRPYTLVCTKTQASYERAAALDRRYREALATLQQ